MGYNVAITICLILLIIHIYSAECVANQAVMVFGKPLIDIDGIKQWVFPNFNLTIASDTTLPVQLYFTWEKDIVKPKSLLYKELSKVCTDKINYDIGSCKFTVKEQSIEAALDSMNWIKTQLQPT
jgi:hypothetical protein